MKMFITCTECMLNNKVSSGVGELKDEGYIEYVCKNGHHCNIQLQGFKFEYLFYQAIKHLVNAENEASVLLFANSLEKFYEFFIKIFSRRSTNNSKYVDNDLIKKLNRSEQQLGAFKILYFITFNEEPPSLSHNEIELRNDVVHNGKLISKEDAFNYGRDVHNIIAKTIEKIVSFDQDIILQEMKSQLEFWQKNDKTKNINISGSMINYISFTGVQTIPCFQQMVDSAKKMEEQMSPTHINEREVVWENQEKENSWFIDVLKKIIEKDKTIKGINYPLKETDKFIINNYTFMDGVKKYGVSLIIEKQQYVINAKWDNNGIIIEEINHVNNRKY